ncbi:MAG TPA: ABC transporter ATP-binding protein [Erysipelotrichaceae bacterium]|nr:ABC transporter ATP-binding protein [Erysipelotrichaceae bacterium]HQA85062.1 ABC transporter ATP-binding protein [Erysipelotrichaceae bacterium]
MEKLKKNRLFYHIYKNKFLYLFGIIALLMVDYLDLYIPLFIGEITDGLTSHTIEMQTIDKTILLMLVLSIAIAVFRFFWHYFIFGTSQKIINSLRKDIFEKLETLSQAYFNKNKTGDIMTRFTNDLDAIEGATGFVVMMSFDAVVLTIMVVYKMITHVSLTLTILTLIPMALVAVFSIILGKKFDEKYFAKQKAFGHLNDAVQESVTAVRVIKAFVQEEKQLEHFKKVNDYNRKANADISVLRAIFWPVLETFIGLSYVVAIILGGYYCLIGEITLGKFITFSSYIGTLFWPMIIVGDIVSVISEASASLKRINEIFDAKVDIVNSENMIDIQELKGEIVFDKVDFRYEENLPLALEDINVKIRKGEMFAILGRTGCGKTTMVNLIARVYDVTSGNIYIDGNNIKDIPLNVLRSNIGYVPQDNFLFSETLKENISFGKLDATDQEIYEACKIADIHDNIMSFPNKYETMLGERGVTLSGGQKQRTSIARAIIKDSPILIMDDSLSAVDTDTEDTIINNLKRIRKDKTTIMIAHRVSTVQSADHILVLEDGKIAEYGTYQQLLDKNGLFTQMVEKQQLEKQLITIEQGGN